MLVSHPSNVRYLTDFSGEDAVLLVTKDQAAIVSDGRFVTQLEDECPDLEHVIRPIGQTIPEAVAEQARRFGLKWVAFEPAALSVADFEALREKLDVVEARPAEPFVEQLRMIKDREEILAIRRAIDMAERAFVMLRQGLRHGESEKDVADTLESNLRRCGAATASFPPIVAVGPRSALPHARPTTSNAIGDADFVLVDWGACEPPYKSDLTRVLVTGKVTPKFEKVYRTVLAAQARGIAAIRPGVLARDVDAEARSVIEEAGFGRFFRHGLGHGLGLDIHEEPRLRKSTETVLEPGMVITVEPGVYLPGWGGIRIEDDILVTPDGCEVLTTLPTALESVRVA